MPPVDPLLPAALIDLLARFGVPGAVVAVALWMLVRKDNELAVERKQCAEERKAFAAELKAERDARVADAKAWTEQALALQNKSIDASLKNWEIFEELQKRGRQ